jgi:parallel beta-helix repeat protein
LRSPFAPLARAISHNAVPLLAAVLTLVVLGCAQSASSQGADAEHSPRAVAARVCTRTVTTHSRARYGRTGVVQQLVDSLRRGQTGCLAAGAYEEEEVALRRPGIVLRSKPGEVARLIGRLVLSRGAEGDVVSGLVLDGRNAAGLPSPTVDATGARFVGDDVTNEHTNICFVLGSDYYGRAIGTVIERNRIHGCGKLPAANHDHGIYVAQASGTRIVGNLIYDNADRGIQLYPNAQGTLIEGNVIDGNGEGIIFSGEEGFSSNDNVVQYNVISDARERFDVESFYPPGTPVGEGNVVRDNCVFGGREGTIAHPSGFSAGNNVTADPGFVAPSVGDFRLSPHSRCAALLRGRLPLAPVTGAKRR